MAIICLMSGPRGCFERGADLGLLKRMSALPLIYNITQSFWIIITYPHHKFTIESKIFATLLNHETTNVLCIFVVFINASGTGQ